MHCESVSLKGCSRCNAQIINGIRSLLEGWEFLYFTISITMAQVGIAAKAPNPDNIKKPGNAL